MIQTTNHYVHKFRLMNFFFRHFICLHKSKMLYTSTFVNIIKLFSFLLFVIMSEEFYNEIINNYKKLYETKEDYDMKIYAGEKPNLKEFHVHSFILKTQSKFFKKLFANKDGIEKKDNYFIINSSNSPKVFEILLK